MKFFNKAELKGLGIGKLNDYWHKFELNELTGIDLSVYSDLSEDDIKNLRTLKGKDLTLKVIEKANDHKKWQRLADERLKEIDTFKSQKPDEKIQKYETFINDLKKDFFGTYNKYSEE